MKLWNLPGTHEEGQLTHLSSRATEHAHEKDVNSIAVAPNDKIIASGSQDKTAKVKNPVYLDFKHFILQNVHTVTNSPFCEFIGRECLINIFGIRRPLTSMCLSRWKKYIILS